MKNLRWNESQLEAHLKAHRDRAKLARERFKQENQSKVRQAKKHALEVNTGLNIDVFFKQILKCEIASTPPSVNHYWERTVRGMKLSDKAKDFHALVRIHVPALLSRERLKLEVIFHFPDRYRRDIDNYLKATIDSLVKCGLCKDDEQFDELSVKRGNVVKGGLIKLRVWEVYS